MVTPKIRNLYNDQALQQRCIAFVAKSMHVCMYAFNHSSPVDPARPPSFSAVYQLYCEFSAKSEKFTVDALDPVHRLADIDTR